MAISAVVFAPSNPVRDRLYLLEEGADPRLAVDPKRAAHAAGL